MDFLGYIASIVTIIGFLYSVLSARSSRLELSSHKLYGEWSSYHLTIKNKKDDSSDVERLTSKGTMHFNKIYFLTNKTKQFKVVFHHGEGFEYEGYGHIDRANRIHLYLTCKSGFTEIQHWQFENIVTGGKQPDWIGTWSGIDITRRLAAGACVLIKSNSNSKGAELLSKISCSTEGVLRLNA